jgi:hypothetical protein
VVPCTTVSSARYLQTDRRFVITVAPQKDICPHARAYPMNAVAMVRNRITTPADQVCIKLNDP